MSSQYGQTRGFSTSSGVNTRTYWRVTNDPQLSQRGIFVPFVNTLISISTIHIVHSPRTVKTAQNRAQTEQFAFDVEAPGLVEVTNESHENPAEHQYVVSIDDVTHELMACTCPHHVHCNAFCKHMAAVENATDDGTLDAFPSEDDEDERISGPYTGYDKYGKVDHRYWMCEDCGAEATRKDALTDCC